VTTPPHSAAPPPAHHAQTGPDGDYSPVPQRDRRTDPQPSLVSDLDTDSIPTLASDSDTDSMPSLVSDSDTDSMPSLISDSDSDTDDCPPRTRITLSANVTDPQPGLKIKLTLTRHHLPPKYRGWTQHPLGPG